MATEELLLHRDNKVGRLEVEVARGAARLDELECRLERLGAAAEAAAAGAEARPPGPPPGGPGGPEILGLLSEHVARLDGELGALRALCREAREAALGAHAALQRGLGELQGLRADLYSHTNGGETPQPEAQCGVQPLAAPQGAGSVALERLLQRGLDELREALAAERREREEAQKSLSDLVEDKLHYLLTKVDKTCIGMFHCMGGSHSSSSSGSVALRPPPAAPGASAGAGHAAAAAPGQARPRARSEPPLPLGCQLLHVGVRPLAPAGSKPPAMGVPQDPNSQVTQSSSSFSLIRKAHVLRSPSRTQVAVPVDVVPGGRAAPRPADGEAIDVNDIAKVFGGLRERLARRRLETSRAPAPP